MGGKNDALYEYQQELLKIERQNERRIQAARREAHPDDHSNDIIPPRTSPFERFKIFVDGNLDFLAQSFRDFPSNMTELKARIQAEREARKEEEINIWRRWTGSEQSPDHIRMQTERASRDEAIATKDATYLLLRESLERNRHVPAQKILDLYRDNDTDFGALDQFAAPMLSFGGACYYKPETVDNLPSTARWGWPAPHHRWLSVEWFKRSPYSPIQLEAHPDLGSSGAKWRAAFEDLLCATLEKPMNSEERVGHRPPYGKAQSTYSGPGLDWMLSLQCRGILPPQLPNLYKEYGCSNDPFKIQAQRLLPDMDALLSRRTHYLQPSFESDLQRLIEEVAIKAQPETEATPLVQQRPVPFRIPGTEQELYDEMPPIDAVPPPQQQGSWVPVMIGDHDEDLAEAADALEYAIDAGDVDAAAECLKVYHAAHGTVSDLLGGDFDHSSWDSRFGPPAPWWSILSEALSRAFPDQDTRRFSDSEQLSQNRRALPQHSDLADEEKPEGRPDILSQLTTKQETRLPDGTVITKMVLKKRFADGREETHESVHTTHKQAESSTVNHERSPKQEEQSSQEKRGWFWK